MRAIRVNPDGQIETYELQVDRCVLCGAPVEEAQVCSACMEAASQYTEEMEVNHE